MSADRPLGETQPREGTDPETVAATREFNNRVEQLLAGEPDIQQLGPAEARRRRRAGDGAFPPPPVFAAEALERDIPGRAGRLRVRVIAPPGEPRGLYLHLHGGGWTIGGADLQDPLLCELAAATGMCAVSVEYRLAPEHPHPAAADDCEDAALWLLENGPATLNAPGRFAIGGESAGAHLAAATLLRLRDRQAAGGFTAATLMYGVYDLAMTPSQRRWGTRNLVISSPGLEYFADCFVGHLGPEGRRDPGVSPLYADLAGLPPALFTVGTLDPLLDDTLFMHARWLAAGNRAELRIWQDAPHLFTLFPTPAAAAARARQHAFLREALV